MPIKSTKDDLNGLAEHIVTDEEMVAAQKKFYADGATNPIGTLGDVGC
jgi:hypothetical protein